MDNISFNHTWEESVLWLRKNNPELSEFCYYDDPIEEAAERFYKSAEWVGVEKILKSKIPCYVLDIGAGRGISSYAFSKAGCEVVALEPDKSDIVGQGCIENLFKNTKSKIQIVSDLDGLLKVDIQFDIIYCRAALHHIPDLKLFLGDIYKLLKKDGFFLATREHIVKNQIDLKIFLDNHPLHKLYGGENAYTLEFYKDCIVNAGLRLIKVLHQYDTVINYFPMTEKERSRDLENFKNGSKWKNIPNFLISGCSILHSRFMKSVNSFYYFPGAHCSFLAIKK